MNTNTPPLNRDEQDREGKLQQCWEYRPRPSALRAEVTGVTGSAVLAETQLGLPSDSSKAHAHRNRSLGSRSLTVGFKARRLRPYHRGRRLSPGIVGGYPGLAQFDLLS